MTPATPARGPLPFARRALKALASLQLTVWLFVFAVLLVFFGTVAQMESGIWTTVNDYFWSWVVPVPFDLVRQFDSVFLSEWVKKDGPRWGGWFPLPGGKLLGGLMLANLLAAHLVRFRLTWKRAGVILVHSGLVLLFVGEFVTREYAVEQRMRIREGATADFAEDNRHMELAFVDASDPTQDRVVTLAEHRLRAGRGRISDDKLPVDVEVVDYFVNAVIEDVRKSGKSTRSTAGVTRGLVATRIPEVSGTDTGKKVDLPAAYVRLFDKPTGRDMGTYLVSLENTLVAGQSGQHEEIVAGGTTYQMALRNARYYKPYTVRLEKFRFDRYPGTQTAKNFSSDVTLTDTASGDTRRQVVRMNDPLRSHGETFYQSSFDSDEAGTVLQVVQNPGWLIPYVSCVMVGGGLLLHFGTYLTLFLLRGRRKAAAAAGTVPADVPAPRPAGWWLPGVCLAVVVVYCGSVVGRMAPPRLPFNLDAFAHLPVLDGGRVKPLDSAARVYLRTISGQSVFTDPAGVERPAIQWFLDTLGADVTEKGHPAWDYRIIRIDNEQLLAQLKFQPREGLRYSFNELRPVRGVVAERAFKAVDRREAGKALDLDERKWIELLERLSLIEHVTRGAGHDSRENKFHLLPPPAAGGGWASLGEVRAEADAAGFAAALDAARARVKAKPGYGPDEERAVVNRLLGAEATEEQRRRVADVLFAADPRTMRDDMKPELLGVILRELPRVDQDAVKTRQAAAADAVLAAHPAAGHWDKMIRARLDKKPDEFNRLLAGYTDEYLGSVPPAELAKARLETGYNRFAPFMQCTALYVIVFVLSVLGFVVKAGEKPAWGEALRRSASWVLYATLVLHTGALLVRMSLMDRPLVFVTNLYSSAVFIGWGCVALGMVLERLYPLGIGNAVAGVLGLTTTIVAHNLATDDTLAMMQAVLDTNFWLATHVTTVTLGYTATFVAGFLGAVYVLLVLAAVVRDGFLNPQPASPLALVSFGAAAAGVVGIPLFLMWFVCTALVAKFEWVHSSLPTVALVVTAGAALFYAGGLLFLKAGESSTDPAGRPAGPLPAAARPLAGLALTPDTGKVLGQMIYGVVCFAMLLSFVGTVLGGIWADQSWGRFWGWDPKENGAVLIVLWNALILHARWCGLVRDRGVAVLAVAGNMICAWSWFGTNQLGIGLHAYGFDTRLADGCTNFWLSQLVIIALGLIPRAYWSGGTAAPRPTPTKVSVKRKK